MGVSTPNLACGLLTEMLGGTTTGRSAERFWLNQSDTWESSALWKIESPIVEGIVYTPSHAGLACPEHHGLTANACRIKHST